MKTFVDKKNGDNKSHENINENVENRLKTLEESINSLVKSSMLNTTLKATLEQDYGDYVDNRPWSEVVRGKRRDISVAPSQSATNNGVNGVGKPNNWRKNQPTSGDSTWNRW